MTRSSRSPRSGRSARSSVGSWSAPPRAEARPVSRICRKRRVGRQREQQGQVAAQTVVGERGLVGGWDRDADVQREGRRVARMRAGDREPQPRAADGRGEAATQRAQLADGAGDRRVSARADLQGGAVVAGRDRAPQARRQIVCQRRDVVDKLPAQRVQDHCLLGERDRPGLPRRRPALRVRRGRRARAGTEGQHHRMVLDTVPRHHGQLAESRRARFARRARSARVWR